MPAKPATSGPAVAGQHGDESEASHTFVPFHNFTGDAFDEDYSKTPQWWDNQEDVVISGISGRFPESQNVKEFMDNLFEGVDMITEDNRRWDPGYYDLPKRHGKIKDLSKFDAGFFGVHPKQASNMDPQIRMLLECAYEAIYDAGINPHTLRGTKSGIFVGNAASETSSVLINDPETIQGYALTGTTRSMFANRLSYCLDFRGPSFTVDTACSSALLALQVAVDAIRQGQCDQAIVAGAHLTLTPNSALQFLRLGMLSPTGRCQSFDAKGDGYVRSECVGCVFIQKKPTARRIYATIVHAKSNTDGYKEQGITFPSGDQQINLLRSTYKEAGLDPKNITYLEAHGTGTKVGDPQECHAITTVFTKKRDDPLLIGSVKSNAGHAEPASGIMSLAKAIIAMETERIPGNLHFQEANPYIPSLTDGRLKVVAENTKWEPGLMGVSSFGFGGSNSHIILKPNPNNKKLISFDDKKKEIPILLFHSARSQEALENIFSMFEKRSDDLYLYNMLCEQSQTLPNWYTYRGYTIVNRQNPEKAPIREIGKVPNVPKRPVWLVYTGMGSQWAGMGRELMVFDVFREAVQKCSDAIEPFGISPMRLIMEGVDSDFQDNTLNCFMCITSIQIGMTDLMRSIGLKEDGVIGHSTGEMAASYADGCTDYAETMMIAYYRGKTILGAKFPPGGMGAVGLSWAETVKRCPEGVYAACHNAPDSVTVSGDAQKVTEMLNQLSSEGVFVKPVNSSGIAFHSPCMQIIADEMRNALLKVLPHPKERSPKWITSSVADDQLDTDLAKYSSADYHVNNMVSAVLFNGALKKIPENSIVIEVAPHCLLQAILKRGVPTGSQCFGLMSNKLEKHDNNMDFFLANLGKIYQAGANFEIQKLYPKVEYPVPRGTPMLSYMFGWDHSHDWEVYTGPMKILNCVSSFTVDPFASDSKESYVLHHVIDGRVIYPFTGYLVLAWKAICKIRLVDFNKTPVIIENVRVLRATIVTKPVKFDVVVTLANGDFEVLEDGNLCATGRITILDEENNRPFFYENLNTYPMRTKPEDEKVELTTADLYKEYQLRGYEYGPAFRGIQKACNSGETATLLWTGNWVTFIDTLLQTHLVLEKNDTLRVPIRLRLLRIDPARQAAAVEEIDGVKVIRARNNVQTFGAVAGGCEACDLVCQTVPRRSHAQKVTLERISFMPFKEDHCMFESPEVQKELHSYSDLCRSMTVNGIKKLLKTEAKLPNRALFEKIASIGNMPDVTADQLEKFAESKDSTLIKLLNDVFNQKPTKEIENFTEHLATTIKTAMIELEKDKLWNFSWTDRPAIDQLDNGFQNTKGHWVKLAVLEPDSLHVTKKLHWAANIHPLLETEWLIIGPHVETQFTEEERAAAKVQTHEFDIDAEDEMSEMDKDQDIIVLDRVLHRKVDIPKYLAKAKQLIRDDGFVMVNEVTGNFETAFAIEGLQQELPTSHLNGARKYGLYYEHADWVEIFEKAGYWVISWSSEQLMTTLYLLRKIPSYTLDPYYINVDDVKEFTWIEPLQKAIENRLSEPQEKTIVMYSNQVRDSGILGMGLCFREEYKQNRTRTLVDLSFKNRNGPSLLNKDDPAVQDHMKKDLLFNIYRDGQFGNYKHVPLYDDQLYAYEDTEHAFINTLTRGDLSTLAWVSSSNKYFDAKPQNKQNGFQLASVYYASLNFRDIMLATGRLPPDAIPKAVGLDYDCLLGMEYTGRLNTTGERVMGIAPAAQAMGTTTVYDYRFCWGIPKQWTMEQAATVPVAYSTAYYALMVRGRLRKGEKVLIHSGSGGVGIAAITVALAHGCEVFTTVSTDDKKKFLQHRFPQLLDKHICNSRTTEFELHIKQQTMGLGVDVILNSLSDDKLQASVRCLAQHGRFCEIGKFDLASDTALGMSVFLKNATFHGVLMDSLCSPMEPDWEIAAKLLGEGILNGTVKPLPTTVFDMNKAEEAFRYMAHGKHIGKVMLKVRNEESELKTMPKPVFVKAVRRTQCHPQHVYIVVGGLGGFGLELTNWLITRGAQKVILTGRSGIKTGYQHRYVLHWRATGVDVKVSSLDISDEAQTYQLIKEAQEMGPVGGVFNLGMVLRDTLFENQNVKNFQDTCGPKYYGTQHLDRVTRKMCGEELRWFVAFSSLTAGRGNTGQTSYAFANSAVERIIEQRRYDKLSGVVIQWGAIGDVGIIMETMGDNNTVVSGSIPQRIASCMQAMDSFLCLNHPMVTSFVKSELQSKSGGSDEDVVDAIAHILGVSDPSQLNPDANLGDLGLDSLMGVEIKQALERDYDIVLSMKDIRSLTLTKLRNMAKAGKANKNKAADDPTRQQQILSTDDLDRDTTFGYKFRIDFNQVRPDNACEKLNDVNEGTPLFFVHSIEGIGTTLISLAKQLPYPCYCFQLVPEAPTDAIENLAAFYTKQMKEVQPKGPYRIIGYSYGACIAFDMAIKLQLEFPNDPHIVEPLILLDGSHHYMRLYRKAYRRFYNIHTEDLRNDPVFETEILVNLLLRFAPLEYKATREQFLKMSSIDERIGNMVDTIYASGYIKDKEVLRYGLQTYWKKMMMGDKYDPKLKFQGDMTLVRAKTSAAREEDVGFDYGLSEVTTGVVHTYAVEGDHDTFIHNESAVICAKHIMNAINNVHTA